MMQGRDTFINKVYRSVVNEQVTLIQLPCVCNKREGERLRGRQSGAGKNHRCGLKNTYMEHLLSKF